MCNTNPRLSQILDNAGNQAFGRFFTTAVSPVFNPSSVMLNNSGRRGKGGQWSDRRGGGVISGMIWELFGMKQSSECRNVFRGACRTWVYIFIAVRFWKQGSFSDQTSKVYQSLLVWLSQLEHRSVDQKVMGLIRGQGTCLGCCFNQQSVRVHEQLISVSLSH